MRLYLLTEYHMFPGKREEYLEAHEKILLPQIAEQGTQFHGMWRLTSAAPGPTTEFKALSSFDSWKGLDHSGQTEEQLARRKAWVKRAELLRSYTNTLMEPVPFSPMK